MLSYNRVGIRGAMVYSLVIAVACGTAPSGNGAAAGRALTELRVADSSVSAAIAARDAEQTAAYYADDAVIMPVAEPIVEGRQAILE
jgi:hypothetical protein